jgi:hypothetical protein
VRRVSLVVVDAGVTRSAIGGEPNLVMSAKLTRKGEDLEVSEPRILFRYPAGRFDPNSVTTAKESW